jgi:hypothetical protein
MCESLACCENSWCVRLHSSAGNRSGTIGSVSDWSESAQSTRAATLEALQTYLLWNSGTFKIPHAASSTCLTTSAISRPGFHTRFFSGKESANPCGQPMKSESCEIPFSGACRVMRVKNPPLFKIARVLVRLDHVAGFIANANHSAM